jgi:hypothetical protein
MKNQKIRSEGRGVMVLSHRFPLSRWVFLRRGGPTPSLLFKKIGVPKNGKQISTHYNTKSILIFEVLCQYVLLFESNKIDNFCIHIYLLPLIFVCENIFLC